MKKIIVLIIVIFTGSFFILNSCKREDKAIPVAIYDYSFSNECSVPSEVNFENLSIDAEIYRWNFGDSTEIVYEKNPKHLFQHEGIYNVELTAYGNGGMHVEVKVIYIVSSPIITFSANDTVINANESVQFTTTTLSGVLPSAWFWNFGDGTTSNLQNPIHTYITSGLFDVTLTAVNACGSSYIEKKKHITVNSMGSPPTPDFLANTTNITTGQFVNFTDLTINNPTNWNWTFNGAVTPNSTQQNPNNIQYNLAGNYSVTLTASNLQGSNSITKTQYIHVLNNAPSTVFIKKITVKQMGFPPMQTVNLYYKLADGINSSIYLNGLSQIVNNITQANLPIIWNINPIYEVVSINYPYKIVLFDKKIMPPGDLQIGFIQFNIYNFTNNGTTYPTIINLIQSPLNIEIELQWQ
jgi:PKD repeat protein